MHLPDLRLLRLSLRFRAQGAVALPAFLGSTLRGAFGNALKRVECFVPPGNCLPERVDSWADAERRERCWFFDGCLYQYVFESPNIAPREESHPMLRGQREAPHPFVIVPPDPHLLEKSRSSARKRGSENFNHDYRFNHFSTGDRLDFSCLLMGRATSHWAKILVALRLAGAEGLGKASERMPFRLEEALAHNASGKAVRVFRGDDPSVATVGVAPVRLDDLVRRTFEAAGDRNALPEKIRVDFVTPTSQRILLGGRDSGELKFAHLIRKLTERIEFLARLHEEPPRKVDYRELVARAENVRTGVQRLRFYDYEQESGRKDRKIKRHVFMGFSEFTGDLGEFMPFLRAAEILNVGPDTAHGMGRIVVSVER